MGNNNWGLVLGGTASGFENVEKQKQEQQRANQAAADAHAVSARNLDILNGVDAIQRNTSDPVADISGGSVVGSSHGDAQPAGDWLTDRGIDASKYAGMNAAQLRTVGPFSVDSSTMAPPPYSKWVAGNSAGNDQGQAAGLPTAQG